MKKTHSAVNLHRNSAWFQIKYYSVAVLVSEPLWTWMSCGGSKKGSQVREETFSSSKIEVSYALHALRQQTGMPQHYETTNYDKRLINKITTSSTII